MMIHIKETLGRRLVFAGIWFSDLFYVILCVGNVTI